MRAQKVAAWGEVARKLAHEIKNPLTPIQLSAQRVRKAYLKGAPDFEKVLQECTDAIVEEVDALKNLVDEFAQFARLPAANLVSGSLHDVIEQALSLYDGLFAGVTVERRLGADVPPLRIDPDQMKRVLINLVDNAIDATDKRGRVTISTDFDRAQGRVRLGVADDGPGIPAEARDKLFVPHLLDEEAGERAGAGHRQPDHSGAPRRHQGRREPAPWREVRDRAAGLALGGTGRGKNWNARVDPGRRRRSGGAQLPGRHPRGRGLRGGGGGDGRGGPDRAREPPLRPPAPRRVAARNGRAGSAGARAHPRSGGPGGRHLRPRIHRDRGQGRAHGRAGFRREAPGPREDPARGQERVAPAQAGDGAARPQGPGRAPLGDDRRERGHPRLARGHLPGRSLERPRAHLRRERDGQGAGRAQHPPPEPAHGRSLRGGQLRGHPRGADRERALRPRPAAPSRALSPPRRGSSSWRTGARSSSTRSGT